MIHGLRRPALILAALALAAATTTGCGGDDDGNGTGPPPTLELQSGNFTNGQFYSHAFANAGTYNYRCTLHSGMTGVVNVSASAPVGDSVATVNIPGTSFSPSSVTIAVGGRVVWTNNAGQTHNVTSTN